MNIELNWIDYSFFILFIISIVFGFIRGFIRGVVSLLFLIAAVYLAVKYAPQLANSAGREQTTSYLILVGIFLLIFIVTIIIGGLVSYLLNLAFQFGGLGFLNSFLGGLFGLVRAVVISIGIIYVVQLTPASNNPMWHKSKIVMYFQPMTAWLKINISSKIEMIKGQVNRTVQGVNFRN
ncbi:hypothetical protein TUM19329_20230 [Legionella antarctica]|uniref:Colicin V n=1 Tax=Legionella antarctica TaxID=2708020 RepID=A0A6F8T6K6_9GAMM|nr:CvpA family protein [Legionella antarctica]BCA95662.1 hypothetical protein TUM19329_20230 [Legionella antarctica]